MSLWLFSRPFLVMFPSSLLWRRLMADGGVSEWDDACLEFRRACSYCCCTLLFTKTMDTHNNTSSRTIDAEEEAKSTAMRCFGHAPVPSYMKTIDYWLLVSNRARPSASLGHVISHNDSFAHQRSVLRFMGKVAAD
ncbi:hypothetical protein V8C42DRAFT_15570 [Trichoderma barbatum]